MEFKVRAIGETEEKSIQEKEQQILEQHGAAQAEEAPAEVVIDNPPAEAQPQEEELSEEKVLSYIGKKYGKDIKSFDELTAQREANDDLPEDVAAYFKYKKETGRGIEDFVRLNKDFDKMNPDALLKEYLMATEKGLDAEDIDALMQEYSYDEDVDDDATIKKAKIAKKKKIAEAKEFFNAQKETYRKPVESTQAGMSKEEREEIEAYRRYIQEANTYQEESKRKAEWFEKKTEELFSKEFKGFEFDLEGKKVSFSPGDATELRKLQSNPMNFIGKYLDENGLMKDAPGYHKALSIAMNPDKFAKFFYEQGKADAVDDVMRKTKNINMDIHRAPEAISKGGMQIKAVSDTSGKGLKIRSNKKS